MNKDAKLLAEAYGQVQAGQQPKIAKIHSKDVWELNPPLEATESRWPDANLTSKGEMKQFPVTVEYLHLTRNKDGEFDAIDAEDPSRSTIINLPLPQGFNPKASSEEILKALGYTVTEKDGQTNFNLGENNEDDAFIQKNLSNLLTPIKTLNTPKAISYISKRMDEMIKQVRGFKDWGYILDGDNKPFYHEDGTGKLRALVSVVDNRGQRNKTGRVTVDPNMLNSRNYYDRILNIAVEEYLDMVDDETRNKKMKGEAEEGSVLPDVNAIMKKDEAYNILAKHLGSQDLSGVEDLPNGIGEDRKSVV
jgi:hypothetical protein